MNRIEESGYPMERRSLLRGVVVTLLAWTSRRAQALLLPHATSLSSSVSLLAKPSALLVRIDMIVGKPPQYKRAVGDVVRRSLLTVLDVPKPDWFEVISEHSVEQMPFARNYLGIHRTDDCVFIQVTLRSGHGLEFKRRFYRAITDGLHQSVKMRREDVFINLVEVPEQNWSLGHDGAQGEA
jgi:4-oxalocrotonate tautomerase